MQNEVERGITMNLQREKVMQAIDILKAQDMDMWMIIGRETMMNSDPVIPLISKSEFGGMTAAIICQDGTNSLIANHLDAGGHRLSEVYDEVIEYTDYNIFDVIKKIFNKLNPRKLALNYSEDVAADGLTVGLYNQLMVFLKEIDYKGEVCSSEHVIAKLRGQKSPTEIDRIKISIGITMDIFEDIKGFIKPGIKDTDIFNYCKEQMYKYKVTDAWDPHANPIVSVRNDSVGGHAGTIGLTVNEGDIIRLDFGVKKDGYCSDLQRNFYVPKENEERVPEDVVEVFKAVQEGILLGAKHMTIGTAIDIPDTLVKQYLADSNLPVYNHSLGHQIGSFAHDGGLSMHKKWIDKAKVKGHDYKFEENMVYTIEFGCASSRGVCAQEEIVVIRENGVEWLSKPQEYIYICK